MDFLFLYEWRTSSIKLIAIAVKSEKAFEIGPTPKYKKIKTHINAMGKPNENRFNDGADLVIMPIEHCINNNPPTIGKLIKAAKYNISPNVLIATLLTLEKSRIRPIGK